MASSQPDLTSRGEAEKSGPALRPRRFLFINKDLDSDVLSRSSGQVAASINSHVQRWQDKKGGRSKAQSKPPTSQQSSKAPAYRDCITKFRRKSRKRPEKDASKEQWQFERQRSNSNSSGPATANSATPESPKEMTHGVEILDLVKQNSSPLPRDAIYTANFSGADCIDPFQSTYAHYPGVQPILQYYISFKLISTFQSDTNFKAVQKEPSHSTATRTIVQGSLSRQMHMYALLAATSARMKRVSGIRFPRESSPEFLLHTAIRCIREHFSSSTGPLSGDDRQVILDIFYLCVCEWYEKSYDVARIHLAFVRHFWKSLRPSDSIFDQYIHDVITYNDVFLAIETDSSPLFELTWEPAPLPAERVQEIEDQNKKASSISPSKSPLSASTSSRSPLSASNSSPSSTKSGSRYPVASGFTAITASTRAQLPIELIVVLVDLIPLIQTAHYHTHTLIPQSSKETQWVSLKTQALLHKLLSLQARHQTLAEAIRLSFIILLSCMSTSAAWRIGKIDMALQAFRLRSTIAPRVQQDARYSIPHHETLSSALSPSLSGMDDTLLLWMLITGAFAAQNAHSEEQWFFAQAIQVLQRLRIADSQSLKTEILRYIYVEHLEGVTFERFCNAAGLVRPNPVS